jgi:radical SAM protein with 4Fe4S-binding SPASM domain
VLKQHRRAEDGLSAASFARTAYQEILGRDIDPEALSAVVQALASGKSQTEILIGLVHSEEYFAKVVRTRPTSVLIRGGLNSAPAWIQVESTSNCNLHCKLCPSIPRRSDPSHKTTDFPEALWPEIFRCAPDIGYVMLHGFGEPLCCPSLFARMKTLDEAGIATGFSTNGIGAESLARKLGTLRHLLHVNVSIDSFDPVIYRRLRGADLSQAMRGLAALARNIPAAMISVSSLVSSLNIVGMEAVPEILRDLHVGYFCLQALGGPAGVRAGLKPHQMPEARRILAELREGCSRCGIHLTVSPTVEAELGGLPDAPNPRPGSAESRTCTTPFDSIYIDSTGKVFPCCNAAFGTPIGDLRRQSLDEIWRGSELLKFREELLSPSPPAICRTCPSALPGEHPLRRYGCSIVSLVAASNHGAVDVLLKVRNTGSATWGDGAVVRVGTARPRDRVASGWLPEWICQNRPCGTRERCVPPGKTANFYFSLRPEPRVREGFQLVVEGQCWLPDSQFFLEFREGESRGDQESNPLPLVSIVP